MLLKKKELLYSLIYWVEKMYEGIPKEHINYLPQADEFITDERIVEWTKELFVDNEKIQRCNNINELAKNECAVASVLLV